MVGERVGRKGEKGGGGDEDRERERESRTRK